MGKSVAESICTSVCRFHLYLGPSRCSRKPSTGKPMYSSLEHCIVLVESRGALERKTLDILSARMAASNMIARKEEVWIRHGLKPVECSPRGDESMRVGEQIVRVETVVTTHELGRWPSGWQWMRRGCE